MNNPLAGVDPTGYMINCTLGMGGICDGGGPGGQKNGPTDYGHNCPHCVQTDGSAPKSSGAEEKDGQTIEEASKVGGLVSENKIREQAQMEKTNDIDGSTKVEKRTQFTLNIKKAIFSEKNHKKAIRLAAEYLKLDISIPTEIVVDLEAKTSIGAVVELNGVLTFYKPSFASAERLISTIGHEYVHLDQLSRGTLVNLNRNEKRSTINNQQYFMNEVEGYQCAIDNIEIMGYYDGFNHDYDQANKFKSYLSAENQQRVFYKNYEAIK